MIQENDRSVKESEKINNLVLEYSISDMTLREFVDRITEIYRPSSTRYYYVLHDIKGYVMNFDYRCVKVGLSSRETMMFFTDVDSRTLAVIPVRDIARIILCENKEN